MKLSYQRKKQAVIGSLALYWLISLFIFFAVPREEIYPFFSWNLFAIVPNREFMYSIEIVSIGDTVYDKPLQFWQTKEIFDRLGQSPTDYSRIITDFGVATETGNKSDANAEAARLERMFGEKPAVYRLLKIEYDPVQLWTYHTYDKVDVLAEVHYTP